MKIKSIFVCLGLLFLQAVSARAEPHASLWAMGYNYYGQLGDRTYGGELESTNLPEIIVPTNVTTIAAGGFFSLYVLADGSLWGMGDDSYGELGDGTNNLDPGNMTNKAEMIVSSNVTSVAAGYFFTMFIKSDGSLWGMGDNSRGQLGDGLGASGVLTNRPELIISNGVSAVACGLYYTLFLRTNGSLWAMGDQSYGQLGDGNANSGYFTNKPELITNGVAAIACGADHSLFITTNGSLYVMGLDRYGQLGDGNSGPGGSGLGFTISTPELLTNGVIAIAGGEEHSLFVTTNGALYAMGNRLYGQLGDASTNGNAVFPELIFPTNVNAISAGSFQSFFIKNDGSLWGMGADFYGELGNGVTGVGQDFGTNVPVEIESEGVMRVSAGYEHTLFIGTSPPEPQIEVLEGATVITNGQAAAVDFGPVQQGGTGPILNFTVTNAGIATLDLGTPTVGSGYTVVTNPPATIAAGSNGTFSVQLDTGEAGTISNQLSFANNAPNSSPFTFNVTGTVTAPPPQIEVLNGTTVITNGQTAPVSFGSVQQGGTGLIVIFTVTNAGGQTLDVGTPTVGSGYTVVTNPPATIAAGSHGTFSVQLDTGATGTITNQLSFTNNAPGNNPFTFDLAGTVTSTPTYTFTVSASPTNGGTVSPGGTNVAGSIITVSATNNSGYAFTTWTSNGIAVVSTTNYTFTLNTNVTLVANFSPTYTFTVSASPTNGGTVSPGGTNVAGSTNAVTATANSGYIFTNWTTNGIEASSTTNYSFTLETNLTIVANFVTACTLTLTASPSNGGVVSGGGTFPIGSLHTISNTPGNGFVFLGWSVDASGTNNPLTVTLTTNLNITANFTTNSTNITLTVTTEGDGTVSPNLNGTDLKKGSRYTLTATAAGGNLFSGWTGSITTNKNPLVIKAESSMVLQANFVTNLFPAAKGTYNGLFVVSNVVTEETSGMLKGLTVNQKGTYSGTILINGGSHGISGTFSPDGQATNHITREAGAGGSLTVVMALTSSNSSPQVTGTVSGPDWVADLSAGLAINTPSAEYTMLIMPDTNNAPPTNSPGGDSYALITNKAGAAKIAGALADGTTLSQTVSVAQDGYVPIYDSLYSGKGLLLGWISLDSTNQGGVSLTWIHPKTKSGLYTNGFTNILTTNEILISQWTNPGNFASLTNLTLLDTIGDTNVPPNVTVSITDSGKVTGTAGIPVSGSITPKTGLVTLTIGSGDIKETGHGALLNATNGGGYFLTKTNAQAIKLGP
jgi:uncharacterized repeat protein (TIGR02543 family)